MSPSAERRFSVHRSRMGRVADDLTSQAIDLGWTPADGEGGLFWRDGRDRLLLVGGWGQIDDSGVESGGVSLTVLIGGSC